MRTRSIKIAESLYLVTLALDTQKTAAAPVEPPVNHVMIIDCSGSMSWDLPKLRQQAKNRLPTLLSEKDTLTIIWFSGRGQHGVLLENEPVRTLKDLAAVHTAIDRWLTPQGLTGFKEPIEDAGAVVARIKAKRPGSVNSLFFMSDGCDNQWGRPDILKAIEKIAPDFASATFVEYGYYADRPLLTSMAEKAGGSLIFSEDFDRYVPLMEAALSKRVQGGKRVEVKITGDAIGGFAWAKQGTDLLTFGLEGGAVLVPEGLTEVAYLSPTPVGEKGRDLIALSKDAADPKVDSSDLALIDHAYAAVSLNSVRMKPDVVFPLLKALGDVQYIEQFASCFGKQKYSEFMDVTKTAAFDPKLRFVKGWDPNKVPRDDAYTVLDVMRLLEEDDGARILLDSPSFRYSKIGRGRVDATTQLTDAEMEEVSKLTTAMTTERDAGKIKEITAKIAALTEPKEGLKLVFDTVPEGYKIDKLTFNEVRPNVSFQVTRPATIDLSKRLPDEFKGKIPATFPTQGIRNYTVIKDGLVNVDQLPVTVSKATYDTLKGKIASGHLTEKAIAGETVVDGTHQLLLNLKAMPVINRQMVKAVSAKDFFTAKYELLKAQAAQKVYNYYVEELLPEKVAAGLSQKYGEDAAKWLQEQGIEDYGYQPPATKQAAATDHYMGKELAVSIKSLSSLPKVEDAKKALDKFKADTSGKAKLTPSQALMAPFIDEVSAFRESPIYKKAAAKDDVLKAWLEGQAKAAKAKCRQLIFDIAKTSFTIVVGQTWFSEFSSIDENTMEVPVGSDKISCRVSMKEIEIKI